MVCKHYYKQVLTKELISSSTYSCRNESVEDLIEAHDSYMLEHNIAIPEDGLKLPNFYWLPKLHKNPYSHRFIAASSACTTKPLSITQCLKLILQHYRQYCTGIEWKTGINCFWVVNNSMEVLDTLHKVHRASHVDSLILARYILRYHIVYF